MLIEREKLINQNTLGLVEPRGSLATFLQEEGYITRYGEFRSKCASMVKEERRIQELTDNGFYFNTSITVPEYIKITKDQVIQPMIFINEEAYGVPTQDLEGIPDLIIFNEQELWGYLIDAGSLRQKAVDGSTILLFPGGGGRYIRGMLESKGVVPANSLEVDAKRQWEARGEAWCKVNLPLTDEFEEKLDKADHAVFIDDTICSGSTIEEVFHSLDFYYSWQPSIVTVIVEALATPRKKDAFTRLLRKNSDVDWTVYAALFYGGEIQRPRLLTTGSIIRGQQEPERFSEKRYPPELIERVRAVVT